MKSIKNNIKCLKKPCTGCYVCSNICPRKAVNIKEKGGFLTAIIDESKCINCGLCLKVCHINSKDTCNDINNSICYEAYSKSDSVLANSTSGGAGYELSKYFINKGYQIIGCKFDYQEKKAKHDIVSSIENLYLFTGSKYIQSNLDDIFSNLNQTGKYVFIGTPCQCFGMKKYLSIKKLNIEIVFIDFFCHGFIPEKFFEIFYAKHNPENVKKIEFRCKDKGWHNFLFKFTYKDDSFEYIKYADSEFGKVFLKDILLLDTCYDCDFRFNKIASDIRIGDYWGEKHKYNTKGMSVCLGGGVKGEEILKDFFTTETMVSNFIPIKEIAVVKGGPTGGRKTKPRINTICVKLYKIFGTYGVLKFLDLYGKLRG